MLTYILPEWVKKRGFSMKNLCKLWYNSVRVCCWRLASLDRLHMLPEAANRKLQPCKTLWAVADGLYFIIEAVFSNGKI